MIFGIGTDIVRVERMRKSIEKYGEKFARRILTDNELEEYKNVAQQEHFLARRFAAKEATSKAMGTGFSNGLSLKDIGIAHDQHGKPLLEFTGPAKEFLENNAICASHISLADEEEYAVAFVTLVATS